jgi:hypothetical protein
VSDTLSDVDKEFAGFLGRDFEKCFDQLRHYDKSTFEVLKFAFTAYGALGGAALTLYRWGASIRADFRLPAAALLTVGFLLGVCCIAIMTRNRTYYVAVARYVNEHRKFYLTKKPLGFANESQMYSDSTKPPFFNWRSSQALLLAVLTLLNSAMLIAAVVIIGWISLSNRWGLIALGPLVFILQLAIPVTYLVSREGQSSDRAVFGSRA